MKIGIDATNLKQGGGISHLLNILSHFNPTAYNTDKIIIWASQDILAKIDNYPWLEKRTDFLLNLSLIHRYIWFLRKSKKEFRNNCDILFSPGGLYCGNFTPYVTMSRNMLLFDKKELKKSGVILRCKLLLSRKLQIHSLKKSSGIIFISDYAKNIITAELNLASKPIKKISHGISSRFRMVPEKREFCWKKAINLLYVSHIYEYKHPWNVVLATEILKKKGYNVKLNIIGGGNSSAQHKLNRIIQQCDPNGNYIQYLGLQSYENIDKSYKEADIFVYASTCENMPNILIEAMSAAMPIACSDSQPMPEFLKDSGIYFNALDIHDIANRIEELINSPELCKELSQKAFDYSKQYDWHQTSEQTFKFIQDVFCFYKK